MKFYRDILTVLTIPKRKESVDDCKIQKIVSIVIERVISKYMRILKVPRQLGPIANASIFVACFPLQPYPPCLSNLGEELVYLDEKKAGWKDDCLFIFGTLQKKKKKKMFD